MRKLLFSLLLCIGIAQAQQPVFFGLLKGAGETTPPPTGDADAAAYIARLQAAGATVSSTEQTALNAFFAAMKAGGYYSKFHVLGLGIWNNNNANVLNAVSTSYTATISNATAQPNGILMDAAQTVMNSNYTHSTGGGDMDNNHLSIAMRAIDNRAWAYSIGAISNPANYYFILTDAPVNGADYTRMYDHTVAGSYTNPTGHFIASRVSNAGYSKGINGAYTYYPHTRGASNQLVNLPVYIGSLNEFGSSQYKTAGILVSWSIGLGLTPAQMTAFDTDLENFLDAVGKGIR